MEFTGCFLAGPYCSEKSYNLVLRKSDRSMLFSFLSGEFFRGRNNNFSRKLLIIMIIIIIVINIYIADIQQFYALYTIYTR